MTADRITLAIVLAHALGGCTGVQHALDPAADQSDAIVTIWQLMVWICGAMYALVLAGVAAVIVRGARRRASLPAANGEQPDDRRIIAALAAWTALIALLLVVLTVASYAIDRALRPRDHADLEVRITGKQWWWQVEYLHPDASQHLVTANELRLPFDRTVRIELRSADVIHSFWVPNLAGKRDLIPGRTTEVWLTPRRAGSFRGQCAEFCGLQHAHMALDVTIDEPAEFEAWRARQLTLAPAPSTPTAIRGELLFTANACATCHSIKGTRAFGVTGPDLTHLASRRTLAAGALPMTRAALQGWIADPQSSKPGVHMPAVALEPDELEALVDYLMTLE